MPTGDDLPRIVPFCYRLARCFPFHVEPARSHTSRTTADASPRRRTNHPGGTFPSASRCWSVVWKLARRSNIWLGLILPGNILGLFLLLTLLGTGVLPVRWVADAARWLLWLLPLLFMPIFVYALHNRDFWVTDHGLFAGTVAAATLLLWMATGHIAQWMLRKKLAR